MSKLTFITCIFALGFLAQGQDIPNNPNSIKVTSPTDLDHNSVEHIYCAPGLVTTLQFATDSKVENLRFGSEIFVYDYDEEKNLLDLWPSVQEGVTNMRIMIDDVIYVFILHVESSPRTQFRRTFTISGEASKKRNMRLKNAPIMKPDEVPYIDTIKVINRLQRDPSYIDQVPALTINEIDKKTLWNGNPLDFKEVYHFENLDILVFRIQWRNISEKAYFLNCRQYSIHVMNQRIPVTGATQEREIVFPGQMDEALLFVQGHRLTPDQPWQLRLPPEEDALLRVMGTQ